MSAQEDRPGREVAYRLLAAEYDDASLSYAESDEERAPNYVITPTGARVNRLFVVGTLTEISSVNDDMLRARIVDPTGAFVVYAGQYQPDALAALESLEPPAFVAVTGKARTFQPDDSEQVYTSIRPESIATVDADTRDRWVIDAAERTHDRIETYAAAAAVDADGEALTDALLEAGLDRSAADGVALARDHYGTTPTYLDSLRALATEAVEVVAGKREQVAGLDVEPGTSAADGATFADLAGDGALAATEVESDGRDDEGTSAAEPESITETDPDPDGDPEPDAGLDPDVDADGSSEPEHSDAGDAASVEPESVDATEPESGRTEATDGQDSSTDADAESVSFDEGDDVDEGDDELGDFDGGGMYEMDDEEREEIEAEFGAEFTTGTDVDEPGEADIDVPEDSLEGETVEGDAEADTDAAVASEADEAGDADTDVAPESDSDIASASDSDVVPESDGIADEPDEEAAPAPDDDTTASDGATDEPDEEIDLQERVVETMSELDDGEGADRSAVVETVTAETGAAESDVEEAIQSALMGGQCYEPDDDTLKAI
ncbi:hypothetical protein OB905_02940 [Halobacteria archaeon AArc-dxtr1]|nr:hypothetical protein [Halobacteria archaeon AArc-dxtr1]